MRGPVELKRRVQWASLAGLAVIFAGGVAIGSAYSDEFDLYVAYKNVELTVRQLLKLAIGDWLPALGLVGIVLLLGIAVRRSADRRA